MRATMRGRVGFVPTMGALHAGHLALLEAAKSACSSTIVSIFVNPTQFSDAASAAAYPTDTAGDVAKLEAAGCDVLWVPTVDVIYPTGDATMIDPAGPALAAVDRDTLRPSVERGPARLISAVRLGPIRLLDNLDVGSPIGNCEPQAPEVEFTNGGAPGRRSRRS